MSPSAPHPHLARLVGSWTTESTHPMFPGAVVTGTAEVYWLEGERFLAHRVHLDHPDFPDSLSIIGAMGEDRARSAHDMPAPPADPAALELHYYDSRGVFRVMQASIDAETWRLSRMATGFSQRFTGKFADGGRTIVGRWELSLDDVTWADDLQITYRRRP